MLALSSSPRRSVAGPIAIGALVLAAALCAPGSSGAQSPAPRLSAAAIRSLAAGRTAPAPRPFAAFSASLQSLRDSIVVSIVQGQIGTRYVTGGTSPVSGFDCSGLVKYVMGAMHVALPRTAAQQAETGLALGRDTTALRPGDLLTFGRGTRGAVSHIGIYVGHGRFVHASSVAGRVIESPLDRSPSPLIKRWRGTRRVVAGTAVPAVPAVPATPVGATAAGSARGDG